jgi:hypothetical protein
MRQRTLALVTLLAVLTVAGALWLARPSDVIAEGRVVDASGRPVAGALVLVHASRERRDDAPGELEPTLWETAETGKDGAFTVRGSTSALRMEIGLDHERLSAVPLGLPVGSRGIEIAARESGGLTGQVLVDPGVPAGELRLKLRPEDMAVGSWWESFDSSSTRRTEIAADGRFRLGGLLPWSYTFTLVAGGAVLVEIPGVEVVSGEVGADPRLAALDVRGRLSAFTLELVPPSPELALSGTVCFTEAGTSSPVHRKHFEESPVVVVTPLAAIDVLVRARECRLERLSALAERTEVRLRPFLPVRLALPRDVLLPGQPLVVSARLEREGERREERARSYSEMNMTPPFDEHGEALFQAVEPGRHLVRWFVERREHGGFSQTALDIAFEQVVVVEDRPDEQRIELALTNAALTAALEPH